MEERRNRNPARPPAAAGESPAEEGAARPRERGSFGAWLRTQREARGVSIQAIAETSKISLRYLEAMEGDRFDVLPAPVFVRGFLREYARVVGLDADEVVNFYLLAQPSTTERAVEARVAPPRGEREPARRASLVGYGVMIAALLALFVGVAAAISWWASRRAERASERAAASAPAAPRVVPPAPRSAPRNAPVTPPAAASAAPTAGVESESPAAPLADRLRVVLEFQQDCWVEVVLDGQRRESELKAGGETLALEADDYVSLTLGNAPAVRIEVNGRPYPLAAQDSRVVRDLRIDRTTLAAPGPAAAAAPGQ
jgi:cytoskeleton protein RodZ